MTDAPVLIRGQWIIVGADDDAIRDGAVLVEKGRIEAVGPFEDLRRANADAVVKGSDKAVVIPGLVNAHHHSGSLSYWLHGIRDDLLEPWILATRLARRADEDLGNTISAAALIRTGITTSIDLCGAGRSREDLERRVATKAEACRKVGLRAFIGPGASDRSLLIHGPGQDAAFLASLPEPLRSDARQLFLDGPFLSAFDYLDGVEALARSYAADPLISVWYGPPGPQWVDRSVLIEASGRAERLGIGVQTHGLESFYEKLEGLRAHGKTTMAHLDDLGVLNRRFSIAHGVWLTADDIDILARTGAGVSHNPSSNLRLKAGIAPLNALLSAGVTVGLGLDATALNDDDDMFTEMRLALRLHREPFVGAAAPGIRDVFRMATKGGAKILGLDGEVGRLAPGYRADLAVIGLDRIAWPWLAPEADPLETVIMRARADDVETVMIDGRIVLEEGRHTGIDLQAVGAALASELDACEADADLRRVVSEITPRMLRWYGAWEKPATDAYAPFNSKI